MNKYKLNYLSLLNKCSFSQAQASFFQHYQEHKERTRLAEQSAVAKRFFQKAIDIQRRRQMKVDKINKYQQNAIFLETSPVKNSILAYHNLRNPAKHDPHFIASTLYNIGTLLELRQNTLYAGKDYHEDHLPRLTDYKQIFVDLKCALTQQEVVDYDVLEKVMKAMIILDVKDMEIAHLVLQKFDARIFVNDLNLYKLDEFSKLINYFLKPQEKNKSNKEEDELVRELQQIQSQVQNERFKILRLVESIERIKEAYQKFIKLQTTPMVARNINLNIQLLELEEQLVECGLLTVDEIKEQSEDPSQKLDDILKRVNNYLASPLEQVTGTLFDTEVKPYTQQFEKSTQVEHDYVQLGEALRNLVTYLHFIGDKFLLEGKQKFQQYARTLKTLEKETGRQPNFEESNSLSLPFAQLQLFDEARLFFQPSIKSQESLHDVANLLHTGILLNQKFEAKAVQLAQERFLNNNLTLKDERLSITAYGLLYQDHTSPEADKVVQVVKNRFTNIETISDLDHETLVNLSDLFKLADKQGFSHKFKGLNVYNILRFYNKQQQNEMNTNQIVHEQFLSVNQGKLEDISSVVATIQKLSFPDYNDLIQFEVKLLHQISRQLAQSLSQQSRLVLFEQARQQIVRIIEIIQTQELQIDIDSLKNALSEITKSQNSIQVQLVHQSWFGVIQTQNLLTKTETPETFLQEIANSKFFFNDEYCSDPDFEKKLRHHGMLAKNVPLENNISRLILYPYLNIDQKNLQPVAQIYPLKNRKQIQPKFRVDWREVFATPAFEDKEHLIALNQFLKEETYRFPKVDTSTDFILNLMNLRAEIRDSQNPLQTIRDILSLQLWDKVLQSRLNPSEKSDGLFLKRVHHQAKPQEVISPSIAYLLQQMKQKNKLQNLLKLRGIIKRKLEIDLENGLISNMGVKRTMADMNAITALALKRYKARISPIHRSLIMKRHAKYVDVQVDGSHIAKLDLIEPFQRSAVNLHKDQSKQDALFTNKSKAEEKMLLLRIKLKQLDKVALTSDENKYLEQLQKNSRLYSHDSQITNLKIKDIPQQDHFFFSSFSFNNILEFKDFSLNELIYELSSVVNDQLYQNTIENLVFKQNGLNPELIPAPKTNNFHVSQWERKVWGDQARLTDFELQKLHELLNVPQPLYSLKKNKQEAEKQHQEQALNLLNRLPFPQSIMTLWIDRRQEELSKGLQAFSLDEESQKQKVWDCIFKTPYENTSQTQISQFVEGLCQRMLLLKFFQPFFTRLLMKQIIMHPNFNYSSRRALAGYVQIFNIDVPFNSDDILQIAKNAATSLPEDVEI